MAFVPFMKPTAAKTAPSGEEWIHEIKFDGYRTQLIVEGDRVRAFTKNGYDWSDKYARVTAEAMRLPCRSAIIDGEMVVNDERGISSFKALIRAIGRQPHLLQYVAFDLLHLNGEDLRQLPLRQRKTLLDELLKDADRNVIQYSEDFENDGPSFFRACDKMGLEGMVSKLADSPYRSGPTKRWLKTKCYEVNEYNVIGVKKTDRGETVALLATPEGRYVGSAAVTLRKEQRERFWKTVERLKQKGAAKPLRGKKEQAQRVRPGLVASVRHLKGEEMLRHASLTDIRKDDE